MKKKVTINFLKVTIVAILFLLTNCTQTKENKEITIFADDISVNFDSDSGIMRFLKDGKLFASGRFSDQGNVTCEIVHIDTDFGQGQMMKIGPGDNRVFVRKGSPFVYIRRDPRLSKTESPYRRVEVFEMELGEGIPGKNLKGLSPAGLFDPSANPGQHLFTVAADSVTGSGVVAGLARIEAASPVVHTYMKQDRLTMTLVNEYGAAIPSELKQYGGDWWVVGLFSDVRKGLEAYGNEIARFQNVNLKPCPTGYMSWYSEKYGGALNDKAVIKVAAFQKKVFGDYGYDFVQIDDLWQNGSTSNGPAKDFTQVNSDGPYPEGMKSVAEKISKIGLTPGLWMLPFAINHNDEVLSDRKHLIVLKTDGSPYEVNWSGTALDLTRPDALAYVKKIIRQAVMDWGYSYLKLDGIHIGMATDQTYPHHDYVEDNFGNVTFHDPDKSNIQVGRAGLKAVREAAGKETFILGCATPQNERSLTMTMGLVDAMRVGPDNVVRWGNPSLRTSIVGALRSSSALYFLNGRVWWNDPDAIYARNSWPLNEVRCYAGWVALTGMLNNQTDWSPDYSNDRIDLLRKTMPNHQLTSVQPVDLLENDPPRIWTLDYKIDEEVFRIIGLFNWGDEYVNFNVPLEKLGLDSLSSWIGFEFWKNKIVDPFEKNLIRRLPGRHCEIISLQKIEDHPRILGTSRHVTQGAVDLKKLKWNGKNQILQGTSLLVKNDPYELRIFTCGSEAEEEGWEAIKAVVSEAGMDAGVNVKIIKEKCLTRVIFLSPVNGSIDWSVYFKKLK